MADVNNYERAREILDDHGLRTLSLEELRTTFPNVVPWELSADGTYSSVQVWGNLREARDVIVEGTQYTTRLSDMAQQLRGNVAYTLASVATGDTPIAYVRYSDYEPGKQPLLPRQRTVVNRGDFLPLARRQASVVHKLHLRDDQRLLLLNYSKAADVTIEATYRALFDESFYYPHPIFAVGAAEPARMVDRRYALGGRHLNMSMAFGAAGRDLFENIVTSDSIPLLEAHEADFGMSIFHLPDAQQRLRKALGQRGMQWMRGDVLGNRAMIGGFATARSADQLFEMQHRQDMPPTLLVRMDRGLAPDEVVLDLGSPHLDVRTLAGDHSADDNLLSAGRRVLDFMDFVVERDRAA